MSPTSRSDVFYKTLILLITVAVGLFSCTEYTPKPRGYFRLEPPEAFYVAAPSSLPYSFNVSTLSEVEILNGGWINIHYPSLSATVYCSYMPVDAGSLDAVRRETEDLLLLQMKNGAYGISKQAFDSEDNSVHATLYIVEGDCPSPVQFALTDSVSRFFRGALYYNCAINADSLEPLTRYLVNDMAELIQTFYWKR